MMKWTGQRGSGSLSGTGVALAKGTALLADTHTQPSEGGSSVSTRFPACRTIYPGGVGAGGRLGVKEAGEAAGGLQVLQVSLPDSKRLVHDSLLAVQTTHSRETRLVLPFSAGNKVKTL